VPRLGLLLLALAFGGCACSKRARPVVVSIEVDAFEGNDVVSMTAEQLRASLVSRLAAARFAPLEAGQELPEGATPWAVLLAAGLTEPDLEGPAASKVQVILQLREKGGDETWEVKAVRTSAQAGNELEAIQAAARDALEAALAQAVREARALGDLSRASNDAVAARLSDEDEAVRSAAVRLLARRHDARARPALEQRLEADELTQLRETMGLLVELGDPAAVPALISASRARGVVFQREVAFALGAIGGDEAEAYLDAVATGHDDPLVRASAEQALKELRDRRSRKGAGR
jgi:HEAT repeat protein